MIRRRRGRRGEEPAPAGRSQESANMNPNNTRDSRLSCDPRPRVGWRCRQTTSSSSCSYVDCKNKRHTVALHNARSRKKKLVECSSSSTPTLAVMAGSGDMIRWAEEAAKNHRHKKYQLLEGCSSNNNGTERKGSVRSSSVGPWPLAAVVMTVYSF